jgi:hypothetical protein
MILFFVQKKYYFAPLHFPQFVEFANRLIML